MNHNKKMKWLKASAKLTAVMAAINIIIDKNSKKSAPAEKQNNYLKSCSYHWINRNIHYTKTGKGRPLLLIHNLLPSSAGYEWEKVIPIVAGSRTVYTLDLPGCGLSDKSNITYTNFYFKQLVLDFIRDVIQEKTDVAAIGSSYAFVVSACISDSKLFDKLIFISPAEPDRLIQPITVKNRIMSLIIKIPVFGTLLYNISYSRFLLRLKLEYMDFSNKTSCTQDILNTLYYNAHVQSFKAKALFSSFLGGYLNIDTTEMLKKIENRMLIIIGRNSYNAKNVIDIYRRLQPKIDARIIHNTKNLIPLENHLAAANAILDFVSAGDVSA